jgi:hypothetical protein
VIRNPAALSFFDVIDRPAGLVRRSFRALYPIALFGSLVGVIPGVIQQLGMAAPGSDPTQVLGFAALVYGMAFVALLVWAVTMLAVFDGIRRAVDGEPAGIVTCYRTALRPRALGSLVLPGIAMGAGWVMCCLPGVVLSVLFAFLAPIIVHEGLPPLRVMGRSTDLVLHGNTRGVFPVLGVMLVGLLVTYAIQSIHTLPAMVLGFVVGFSQIATGEMTDPGQARERLAWINVATSIVAAFVVPVGYLYVASALTTMYRKTREQRDGAGLERALEERLAGATHGAPESP